jgi:glyoxylase-like metal-dependent hydrolase (beta-lactamase superfamily II)
MLLFLLAAVAAEPVAIAPDVTVTQLADDVWMHTSYREIAGYGRIPSNGLLVRHDGTVTMIDTAWDAVQTEALLTWSAEHLALPSLVLPTHAHADKMGGLDAVHARGIDSVALTLSNTLAASREVPAAKRSLELEVAGTHALPGLEVFRPGAGHTEDNLVVYVPSAQLLFGGCLIRPAASASLGNTADGDVAQWDTSVARIVARYPDVTAVVPSHGPPGDAGLLTHTIALVKAHRAK